ncbi:MAG: hypothetical protein K1Y02_16140 [Candidatus Hydrogenedentes bacterium]|nr:hypothetical protein [Candidatus Hydrogenedentota bacterium]
MCSRVSGNYPIRLVGALLIVALAVDLCIAEGRDPKRWEKNIRAFEDADKQTPPPQDPILFVGSSTIVGWDVKKWFPNRVAINRGFGGSEIADAAYYVDRIVFPYKPKLIVFYSGDNDIANKNTAEQVLGDFKHFVSRVREKLPNTPIVLVSIKPSIARRQFLDTMREANKLLAEYCKSDPNLHFVDIFSAMLDEKGEPRADLLRDDKLHLNEQGYSMVTEKVEAALKEVLSESAK